MKKIFYKILSILFLALGCSKESVEPDFNDLIGIWSPYQIVLGDGTVDNVIGPGRSVFGAYAESIQLKKDRTFVPLIWESSSKYTIKETEGGVIDFTAGEKRFMLTGGTWQMDFEIIKQNKDTLGLKAINKIIMPGGVYNSKYFLVRRQ